MCKSRVDFGFAARLFNAAAGDPSRPITQIDPIRMPAPHLVNQRYGAFRLEIVNAPPNYILSISATSRKGYGNETKLNFYCVIRSQDDFI